MTLQRDRAANVGDDLGQAPDAALSAGSALASIVEADLATAPVLDLSPDQIALPCAETRPNPAALARLVASALADHGAALGRYGEARLLHPNPSTSDCARQHPAMPSPSLHLGIDVFLPPGTAIHAPLPGEIVHVDAQHAPGTARMLVAHLLPDGVPRLVMYAHLNRESAAHWRPGDQVAQGAPLAHLAAAEETGGWPAHLHLQMAHPDTPHDTPWPERVDPDDPERWAVWVARFPNPAPLLGLDVERLTAPQPDLEALRARRAAVSLPNQSLSYTTPLHIVRGSGSILVDADGRRFLDAYNNVPHVGHAHPRVAAAIADQAQRLATNSRYLSEVHLRYVDALLARAPAHLDTCILLNSGSEANDVALRLARAHTGKQGVAVQAAGYHGITQATYDASHYKFAAPGGGGQPSSVHVLPVPNAFSGAHRGPDAGAAYAAEASGLLHRAVERGGGLAACLLEAFPSVGGQVIPPTGYLPAVAQAVQAAGALLILDEVQTGLGRLGRLPWAFAREEVRPDIVVLGKPIANGYPMGAVLTTRSIAETFGTGPGFFSTFGGNTLACAAAHAVLDVLDAEGLAERAEHVGATLLDELADLCSGFGPRADVRGLGLFLGVELLTETGGPDSPRAKRLVERMRARRVLIGTAGPAGNVLKIRPPLSFDQGDARHLIAMLNACLADEGAP